MLFLIVNCHSANRGDEAAVHAMIDELEIAFPGSEFVLGMRERQDTLICQVM